MSTAPAVGYTPLPSDGPIISDEMMQQFEEDGAILVDLRLSQGNTYSTSPRAPLCLPACASG